MINFYSVILFPFFISLLITLILTPICIKVIKQLGIIDDPKNRKHPGIVHKNPTPRAGGFPFFLGIFLSSLIFLNFSPPLSAIFFAAFISLAIGILDDKYDISPYLRFGVNILSATIIVFAGANISFITNPLGGILFLDSLKLPFLSPEIASVAPYIISVLWIVWVMNMLNWSKGVDGQMPGIVAISAIIIGLLSLRFPVLDPANLISAKLSFIIAGASLAFLAFNFYPAKIFPGYGATSIYLLLAVVSILSSAKLATAILVMAIPMIDGAFTITRRVLSGKSPFWHDRRHLHHLLLNIGVGQRKIAMLYWAISAVFGSLALVLSSKGKLFAIIMLLIIIGGAILFLQLTIEEPDDE